MKPSTVILQEKPWWWLFRVDQYNSFWNSHLHGPRYTLECSCFHNNSWGHHRGDLVISPISMDPLLKWKVFPAENHWGPNWKNLFGLPHIDDDLGLESRPLLQQQHVCKIHHLHICVIVSSILIVLSHFLATFLLISVFPNQCFLKSIVDKIWENHRKSPGMLVACPPLLQWVQFPFAPVLLGHTNFACFTQGTQLQENVNGPTDSMISTRWMGTFRGWSYLSTLWKPWPIETDNFPSYKPPFVIHFP